MPLIGKRKLEAQREWRKRNRAKVNAAERKLYQNPEAREKKRARDRRAYQNRKLKMRLYRMEPDVQERDKLRRFAKEEMPDRPDVVLSRMQQPIRGRWFSIWAYQNSAACGG